jgi:putative FmdB family regulatory protein
MPLYEYECESCGVRFEVIQKFADPSVDTCRACGGKVHRLMSAPAIQFKGTGWYITDYARKDKAAPSADPGSSSPSSDKTPAGGASSGGASSGGSSTTPSTPSTTSSSSSTGGDKK